MVLYQGILSLEFKEHDMDYDDWQFIYIGVIAGIVLVLLKIFIEILVGG